MSKAKKGPTAVDWVTFLRISEPNVSDSPLQLDPNWCAARGVNPAAEIVLRMLREKVLVFIRLLQLRYGLSGWHFLIHDRNSGVPTVAEDRSAYINLRLMFSKPENLPDIVSRESMFDDISLVFTRPVLEETTEIGGVDLSIIKNNNVQVARKFIDAQSELVLRFIEMHDWKNDTASMVRQTLQFWHYFANMLQMSFR